MPPMVLSGELINPAIEQLIFGTAGKIPFHIGQRDFWQLVIWHGPIGSKPQGQFNLYCIVAAELSRTPK
ncbi:MAG: hypothetical protein QGH77_04110, partial [Planctomycetota bacterium]|nr:hypothetical protein [Planctomycetota bacterium]